MLATLGRGATSVAEMQKAAAAMVKESRGNCSSATKMMARAGTSGKHPNNIERDIMRHLGLPLPIHWITVPVLSARDRKTRSELRLPYLMPHELVHYLHETQQVQIMQESVNEFWAHAAQHTDWAAHHEGFGTMPLGGLQMRYPLMNLREFICLGPETLNPVMEVLSWSFGQLAAGGRHYLIEMRGDWKWQKAFFCLKPRPANPLILVPGFRPEFIRICAMHTLHLGVLQLLNGSIFTLLEDLCWFRADDAGPSIKLPEKMILLCSRFKSWASANQLKHSQATMTSGMLGFEGGAYPSLNLKAWNSRLFVVFFEVVLKELVARDTAAGNELLCKELKLASAATTAMCAFLAGMEASPRYMSDEQCRYLHESMQSFLELYEVLIATSLARGTARWKAVPKHHLAWHLVEEMDRSHYNVRFYHSFIDEDYIGQWKLLAQSVPRDLLEYRCLTRYLLRLGTKGGI
ncbi:unnamed protein product [Symbiodinium sp. CCMP2592]|nr:unnamed protein product [Symbiodinium sp. CCMP2592]